MPLTENFIPQLRAAVVEIIEKIVPEELDDFGDVATIFSSLITPNFSQSLNSILTEKFKEEIAELSGLINSEKKILTFYGVEAEDEDSCRAIAESVTTLISQKIKRLNSLSIKEKQQKLTEIQNENQRQLQMRAELSKQAEKIKQSGIIAPGNEGRTLGLSEEQWVQYMEDRFRFSASGADPQLIYAFFENNRRLRYEVNGFSEYQQELIFTYQDRGLQAKHFFEPSLLGIDDYQSWHKYGATLVRVLLDNPTLAADEIAPRVARLRQYQWQGILGGINYEEAGKRDEWQIKALLKYPDLKSEDFNDSNTDDDESLFQALDFLISFKKYEPKAAVAMLKNTTMVQATILVEYDLEPESIKNLDNFQCMLFRDLVDNKIMEKSAALQKLVSGLYTLKHHQAFTYLTQEKMLNTESAQIMLQDLTEEQAFKITCGSLPEEYASLNWKEIKILLLLKKYGLTREHLFSIKDWPNPYGLYHEQLLEIWLAQSPSPAEELSDIVARLDNAAFKVAQLEKHQWQGFLGGLKLDEVENKKEWQIKALLNIPELKSTDFNHIHADDSELLYDALNFLVSSKGQAPQKALAMLNNTTSSQARLVVSYDLLPESIKNFNYLQCILFRLLLEEHNMDKSKALQKITGHNGSYEQSHHNTFFYLIRERGITAEAALDTLQGLTKEQADGIIQGLLREEVLLLSREEIRILLLLKNYGLTREHLFSIQDWPHPYDFYHRELLEIWLAQSPSPAEELSDIVARLKEYTHTQAGGIIDGININYIKQLTPEQIYSLRNIIKNREALGLLPADIQLITEMYANKDLWSQGFSYRHGDTIYKLIANKKLSAKDAVTTLSNLNEYQAQGIGYGMSRELLTVIQTYEQLYLLAVYSLLQQSEVEIISARDYLVTQKWLTPDVWQRDTILYLCTNSHKYGGSLDLVFSLCSAPGELQMSLQDSMAIIKELDHNQVKIIGLLYAKGMKDSGELLIVANTLRKVSKTFNYGHLIKLEKIINDSTERVTADNISAKIEALFSLRISGYSWFTDHCSDLSLKANLYSLIIAEQERINAILMKIASYSDDQLSIVKDQLNEIENPLRKEENTEDILDTEQQENYYNALKRFSSVLQSIIERLDNPTEAKNTDISPSYH